MKKFKHEVGNFVVYTFPFNDVDCAVYQTQAFEVKITRKCNNWLRTVHYKHKEDMPHSFNSTLVFSENEKGLLKNYIIRPEYLEFLKSL